MKFTITTRRLAATGAAAALAAGALVGATTTTASAVATATSDYDCAAVGDALGPNPVPLGTFPMTATASTLEDLIDAFGTFPAGFGVSPGYMPASTALTLPASTAGLLSTFGVTGGTISDFSVTVGDVVAPVPQTVSAMPAPTGGDIVAGGENGQFALPAAGTHQILMPEAFTFTPTAAGNPIGIVVECTTDSPQSIGEMTTVLNDSATVAKIPSKVKKGKAAKLVATVTGGFSPATGKVVFKDGKKKLGSKMLNDNGKAVYKAKGLKKGSHKITAKYVGDGFRSASKDGGTLKVK